VNPKSRKYRKSRPPWEEMAKLLGWYHETTAPAIGSHDGVLLNDKHFGCYLKMARYARWRTWRAAVRYTDFELERKAAVGAERDRV
jgi:hypothetical protein